MLTLAIACFHWGWTANDRIRRTEAEHIRQNVERYEKLNKSILLAWEVQAFQDQTRVKEVEAENNNLRQQIEVLDQKVKNSTRIVGRSTR